MSSCRDSVYNFNLRRWCSYKGFAFISHSYSCLSDFPLYFFASSTSTNSQNTFSRALSVPILFTCAPIHWHPGAISVVVHNASDHVSTTCACSQTYLRTTYQTASLVTPFSNGRQPQSPVFSSTPSTLTQFSIDYFTARRGRPLAYPFVLGC